MALVRACERVQGRTRLRLSSDSCVICCDGGLAGYEWLENSAAERYIAAARADPDVTVLPEEPLEDSAASAAPAQPNGANGAAAGGVHASMEASGGGAGQAPADWNLSQTDTSLRLSQTLNGTSNQLRGGADDEVVVGEDDPFLRPLTTTGPTNPTASSAAAPAGSGTHSRSSYSSLKFVRALRAPSAYTRKPVLPNVLRAMFSSAAFGSGADSSSSEAQEEAAEAGGSRFVVVRHLLRQNVPLSTAEVEAAKAHWAKFEHWKRERQYVQAQAQAMASLQHAPTAAAATASASVVAAAAAAPAAASSAGAGAGAGAAEDEESASQQRLALEWVARRTRQVEAQAQLLHSQQYKLVQSVLSGELPLAGAAGAATTSAMKGGKSHQTKKAMRSDAKRYERFKQHQKQRTANKQSLQPHSEGEDEAEDTKQQSNGEVDESLLTERTRSLLPYAKAPPAPPTLSYYSEPAFARAFAVEQWVHTNLVANTTGSSASAQQQAQKVISAYRTLQLVRRVLGGTAAGGVRRAVDPMYRVIDMSQSPYREAVDAALVSAMVCAPLYLPIAVCLGSLVGLN
jgi:hypothetical protein